MPRFFLHQRGGALEVDDDEGQEFPNLEAVRAVAVGGIRDVLAGMVREGRLSLRERIDVEDRAGHVLLSVGFADAVRLDTP
jgi:hypothetical protein